MENLIVPTPDQDTSATKSGVLAFGFGVPSTIWPNQTIARIAARKAHELGGASVFTQLDVQFDPSWKVAAQYCTEVPGNPPPTLRVAREALVWAHNLGLQEVWISAARPHLPRILRDLNYILKQSRSPVVFYVCQEVMFYWPEEFFSKDSIQLRTRSWFSWWPREIIGLLMPMFIYRRLSA